MPNDTFPQNLSSKDQDRLRKYREYLEFYNGVQWTDRSTRKDKKLTFNYAKVFVDKLVSYLMSGITPAIDPADDDGAGTRIPGRDKARQAEDSLREVYLRNDLDMLDFDTETDCAVLGDAAYKVLWDPAEKRVRITAPDVQGLFAWWQGDDISSITRVACRYSLSKEEVLDIYKVTISSDKPVVIVEDWTARSFTLYIDSQPHRTTRNPYGFIPFVIYPNIREPKKFWGLSDIPGIMEPQRELNRALSQLSRILELSGNPIAVLENIEESEDIAVQPGAVWNVPEGAKAYLLDLLRGGGVRMHVNYIDLLYRTMHDISESPRAAFGGTERDLSGVALQVEMQSLMQKVARKRLIRSAAYRRRNDMILRILEMKTGQDFAGLSSRIVWGSILPQDLQRLAQTEQLLVSSSLHSRHRAMTDLGVLDPEAELDRWIEERDKLEPAGAGIEGEEDGHL